MVDKVEREMNGIKGYKERVTYRNECGEQRKDE